MEFMYSMRLIFIYVTFKKMSPFNWGTIQDGSCVSIGGTIYIIRLIYVSFDKKSPFNWGIIQDGSYVFL